MSLIYSDISGTALTAPFSGTCNYTLKADFYWSEARFPINYPAASAHWSALAAVAHDDTFTMWRKGEVANAGIQTIAELGATGPFNDEVEACGTSCGDALAFECSPFSGVCVAEGEIEVSLERPYVSAASMLAPSPDWFVGVDSANLFQDGWVDVYEAEVFVLDAGTDSGTTYLAPDEVTSPKAPIEEVAGPAAAIFSQPGAHTGASRNGRFKWDGDDASVGTITFVKKQCAGEEGMLSNVSESTEGVSTKVNVTSSPPPNIAGPAACYTPSAMLASAACFILLLL